MASDILFNVGINATKYQQGMNQMQRQTQRLTSTVRSLASAMGMAFGAYGIVRGIQSTTKAFMEQESAERRLEQVTMSVSHANMQQINSLKQLAVQLQKVGVVGDEVTMVGMSQLASFQMQTDSIAKLTPALQTLAVATYGTNISQEQMINIANQLGRAYMGFDGALTRVGITLNDTQKEILNTGTEEQKVATLTEIIAGNFGDLNTAMRNTTEGSLQAAQNAWGDFQELLGSKLAPVLTNIANKLVDDIIPALTSFVEDPIQGLKNLWNSFSVLQKGIIGVGMAFIGLKVGTAAMSLLASGVRLAGGAIVTVFKTIFSWPIALIAAIYIFRVAWINNWFDIRDAFQKVFDDIKPIFDSLVEIWGDAYQDLKDVWGNQALSIANKIRETFEILGNAVWDSMVTIGSSFTEAFGGDKIQYVNTMDKALQNIKTSITELSNAKTLTEIFSGVKSLAGEILELPAKLIFAGFDNFEDESLKSELEILATNSLIFTAFSGGRLHIGVGLALLTRGLTDEMNNATDIIKNALEVGLGAKLLVHGPAGWVISIALAFEKITVGFQDQIAKQIQNAQKYLASPTLFQAEMQGTYLLRMMYRGLSEPGREIQKQIANDLFDLAKNPGILESFMMLAKEIELIFVDTFNNIKEAFMDIFTIDKKEIEQGVEQSKDIIDKALNSGKSIQESLAKSLATVPEDPTIWTPMVKNAQSVALQFMQIWGNVMDWFKSSWNKTFSEVKPPDWWGMPYGLDQKVDPNLLFNYDTGGYTGQGNTNQVAGVVHAGEYVIPQWMVKQSPELIATLERKRLRGYQAGGGVGTSVGNINGTSNVTGEVDTDYLQDIIDQLQTDLQSMKDLLGGIFENLGLNLEGYANTSEALAALQDQWDELGMGVETIDGQINELTSTTTSVIETFDELISFMKANLEPALESGIQAFQETMASFGQQQDASIIDTLKNMGTALQSAGNAFIQALTPTVNILAMILNPILEGFWSVLQPMLNQILLPLTSMLSFFGQIFAQALIPVLQFFYGMLVTFMPVFEAFATALSYIVATIQWAGDQILLAIDSFLDWFFLTSGFISESQEKYMRRGVSERVEDWMTAWQTSDFANLGDFQYTEPQVTTGTSTTGDIFSAGSTQQNTYNTNINVTGNEFWSEEGISEMAEAIAREIGRRPELKSMVGG